MTEGAADPTLGRVRYRLVLFDFDGTLGDTFPWFVNAINQLADELRFRRVPANEVEPLRARGPRQIVKDLGVSWWKLILIARRLRQRMAEDSAQIRPFHGVPEMIARLATKGVAIGVVTSNTERNVRAILGPEAAARITYWACRTSLFGKASRFRALLRRTKLSPGEVVCVGDELRDHEAARRVGIDFAAVSWGFNNRAALLAAGPTMLFDRVDQLADALEANVAA